MGSVQFSDEARRIAETFVAARRSGEALPEYPGRLPPGLDDGYAVQEAAIALEGSAIGGWKVGRIDPPIGGANRLTGPIFTRRIVESDGAPVEMPVFEKGFGAAEAEFLLRIGAAPTPGQRRFTEAEAAALIGSVHVGIEIASSPFPAINELGPAVTISDFGNNNGLVVGPAIPDWRSADINAWPVELSINGERIGAATAAEMLDGPVGAARFLFELAAERGIALEAGQWISSGAVTGVHRVRPGDAVEARFDGRLVTRCTITAS